MLQVATGAASRSAAARSLYLMLKNRIYRRETVDKDHVYPGEHQPIIDKTLWGAVQTRLAGNALERHGGTRIHSPACSPV